MRGGAWRGRCLEGAGRARGFPPRPQGADAPLSALGRWSQRQHTSGGHPAAGPEMPKGNTYPGFRGSDCGFQGAKRKKKKGRCQTHPSTHPPRSAAPISPPPRKNGATGWRTTAPAEGQKALAQEAGPKSCGGRIFFFFFASAVLLNDRVEGGARLQGRFGSRGSRCSGSQACGALCLPAATGAARLCPSHET